MKLLHVIASMEPKQGGVCQALRNLIPALNSIGCRNDVVCLDALDVNFGMVDSFPVHRLGPGRGPWGYSSMLTPWLREHLGNDDVVMIHGLWQFPSYAAIRVIRKLRRQQGVKPRIFVMPHGMLDPWFQRDPTRRLKAVRNWVFWKALEHRVISQADGVLFTCQKELELAREPFRPYRPEAEIVVGLGVAEPPPYGVHMLAAFFTTCPLVQHRPYLLFLSRIHPKKGVDVLLAAYAHVVDNEATSPSHPPAVPFEASSGVPDLVIAGPIDSDYARQMISMASDLGIAGRVHFPGMLSGDAKWGAFYGCEAFILPSHQENFGIAVVEALACSKSVLISDQVNICTEIEADGAAIVERDTIDGTKSMLTKWLSCADDVREQMSENARQCYRKRYLPEAAAKALMEAIGPS